MTKIEAVARAIDAAAGCCSENVSCWYPHARAAIEAMREPTDRMLSLADGYTDLSGYDPSCDANWRRAEFKIAWQVMIDEALDLMEKKNNGN